MYKLIIIFLFCFILMGCGTQNTHTNLYEFNSNSGHRLTDENIMEEFLNYWISNNNLTNTNNFETYIISNRPSAIQQYYYIEIMYLLTGKYNSNDLIILKELVYEQELQFILPIMLLMLENDVLNEYEVSQLKKDAKLNIEKADINNPNFLNVAEYVYSVMILNYIDDYSTDEALNFIYNRLKHKELEIGQKIVYLYYYTMLLPNNNALQDEIANSFLNDILLDYSIKNKNLTEIYYLSHLINYFDIGDSLGIYNINFLTLLEPNLDTVYTRLSIYSNLNILDEETKSQLIIYYSALHNEQEGFGAFVYYTDSNLNYVIYLLLGHMLNLDLVRFPVLDRELLSTSRRLEEDSFMMLLMLSLLQLQELGQINNNIEREVLSRIEEIPFEDAYFNWMYYLLLIAYHGDFTNIALDTMEINKYQFEIYLMEHIENSFNEKNIINTIKYFDILTLYYPNNEYIEVFYYKIRDLFYNYIEENDLREDSIYSAFALLKTIEFRIGKFEDNRYMIKKIFNKVYVKNFLIIHSWDTQNLKSYYIYYYVIQLYDNQSNPHLNFGFLY